MAKESSLTMCVLAVARILSHSFLRRCRLRRI